jgi:hypothetical protein
MIGQSSRKLASCRGLSFLEGSIVQLLSDSSIRQLSGMLSIGASRFQVLRQASIRKCLDRSPVLE